jgi:hypothetical protein
MLYDINFIIGLLITLLLSTFAYFYFSQKIEEQNEKLNAISMVVRAMAEEMAYFRNSGPAAVLPKEEPFVEPNIIEIGLANVGGDATRSNELQLIAVSDDENEDSSSDDDEDSDSEDEDEDSDSGSEDTELCSNVNMDVHVDLDENVDIHDIHDLNEDPNDKKEEKIIRFGEQGAKTAGKPKEGESEAMKKKRKSFKARHNCSTAKDKFSARYWSCTKKW